MNRRAELWCLITRAAACEAENVFIARRSLAQKFCSSAHQRSLEMSNIKWKVSEHAGKKYMVLFAKSKFGKRKILF